MTTSRQPRASHDQTLRLAIVAHGTAALTVRELAAMRQPARECLGPRFHNLKPQFLKHSEEQTLAALAAVSAALDHFRFADDFGAWAIVSSTRYLARSAFAAVIDKYQVDGPWGVSVQAIPHGTPHAVASTLSLALGIHGPCIGAGAAAGDEPQSLLSAASLLQAPRRPGAWLIFSAWSPEPPTDGGGKPAAEAVCLAAALAVVNPELHAPASAGVLGQIEFSHLEPIEGSKSVVEAHRPIPAGLTEFLAGWHNDQHRWHCQAGAHLQIAIDRPADRLTDRPRRPIAA
ncbi:MAG: hypothetical protein ACREJM_05820 [Candidatus Saccharimonadales bacterium]